jgi:hypothetical protein
VRAAILGVALALVAGAAAAFVPTSGKIAFQAAKRNRAEGRAHPFELAVTLRDATGDVVGRGTLLSDPRGLARLELETSGGRTQRHLVRGGEYQAAVDGRLVAAPEPWLPPLFLLQAGSGDVLMSALLSLGAAPEETVLGRLGDAVCYVVGGRDLPPPANASAAQVGSPGPKAAIWVERDGFDVVRIDRLDGTRFVLGPLREQDGARLPEWVRIERPSAAPARLEIRSARRARPEPARDFGMEWLLSP